jgi:hypothetical protein
VPKTSNRSVIRTGRTGPLSPGTAGGPPNFTLAPTKVRSLGNQPMAMPIPPSVNQRHDEDGCADTQ